MFEWIFGIVNIIPIDLCLVFQVVIITRLFFGHVFSGSHSFPCLLSTTVLNDTSKCTTSYIPPVLQATDSLDDDQHNKPSPDTTKIAEENIYQQPKAIPIPSPHAQHIDKPLVPPKAVSCLCCMIMMKSLHILYA